MNAPSLLAAMIAALVLVGGPAVAQNPNTRPAAQQKPAPQPQQAAPQAPQPAQSSQSAADGDVVARVGSRDVTVGEVRAFIAAMPPADRTAVGADPGALAQLVRAYLVNEVVLNAALARKWDQNPEVVAKVERARREAIIDSYLADASRPPANYPSETEIQALYEANKSAFVTPRQFAISQIFFAARAGEEDKAKARVDELAARLAKPGADFMTSARIDAAARDAGDRVDDLGWVSETQIKPEIREQLAGLAKGAVTAPIKLQDGWHLLKLNDTKPAGVKPVAEVREQLAARLRQERASQLRRAAVQELVRQNPAALNELALNRMSPVAVEGAAR